MSISAVRFSHIGHSFSRQVNVSANGAGVRTKTVDLTLPNGNEVSRSKTTTIAEDGSKSVVGSVSVTRGDTTKTLSYTRTVSADKLSAEINITKPNGTTKTIVIDRKGGPEPLPPVDLEPVGPTPLLPATVDLSA